MTGHPDKAAAETSRPTSYAEIVALLPPKPSLFNPSKPVLDAASAADIAALLLHPALEAALHILNDDLPSAHFLVRKMQDKPAFEGILLHAILHRIEGDYDESRQWYERCASSDLMSEVWEARNKTSDSSENLSSALNFVGEVETFSKGTKSGIVNCEYPFALQRKQELEALSEKEFQAILKWCEKKFGTEKWEDARDEYVEVLEDVK
ncbi:hypothetical protein H072_1303 [Dactylellina haptotyla CBS 200.50]|uniref:Uncharacterized protein n=1 Tax=Dactylellina haptotyla (strain CBS 200.50) TaxID=1284197 RepID=S8AUS8_DACHA|nr:hypothetical protein H072_1303 [Dactylellina haptotyla CBS 200.50]